MYIPLPESNSNTPLACAAQLGLVALFKKKPVRNATKITQTTKTSTLGTHHSKQPHQSGMANCTIASHLMQSLHRNQRYWATVSTECDRWSPHKSIAPPFRTVMVPSLPRTNPRSGHSHPSNLPNVHSAKCTANQNTRRMQTKGDEGDFSANKKKEDEKVSRPSRCMADGAEQEIMSMAMRCTCTAGVLRRIDQYTRGK